MALSGNFDGWNDPVRTTFVQGADAKAIYDSLEGMNTGLSYDDKAKALIGSSAFAAAKIDTLLRPFGMRVANLRDLSRPEVMDRIRGRHYTDAPALVLRSMDDPYERNLPLIKQLAEQVETANKKLQLPVLITGFDVQVTGDMQGYGVAIVPRDDFKAVFDERLTGSHDGKRFSEVDEFGLPIFDSNEKRTWYAKNKGLSGLYLGRDLDLGSGDEYLAYSDGGGRVVVVSGAATAKNLEGKLENGK